MKLRSVLVAALVVAAFAMCAAETVSKPRPQPMRKAPPKPDAAAPANPADLLPEGGLGKINELQQTLDKARKLSRRQTLDAIRSKLKDGNADAAKDDPDAPKLTDKQEQELEEIRKTIDVERHSVFVKKVPKSLTLPELADQIFQHGISEVSMNVEGKSYALEDVLTQAQFGRLMMLQEDRLKVVQQEGGQEEHGTVDVSKLATENPKLHALKTLSEQIWQLIVRAEQGKGKLEGFVHNMQGQRETEFDINLTLSVRNGVHPLRYEVIARESPSEQVVRLADAWLLDKQDKRVKHLDFSKLKHEEL
ncbi:hypothetical protein, variant [Capsaspora owczarzaki ATCC 30864]|uniref:Uncharacterized protein n=1 Tax=Capsaspora owczarzaki (strain ATCC 30864) TaxID=595528 RepID=A0A0D2U1B9_CAPO3|nr:hypothetical protein, variant [Capsaspora owczarzaki ATCC 30864]KJE89006.1 hypothetical protein, variant [Capsaspora owczarzaki ATCC 30864]|eukprot:XP_011269945.1 hypothetical protein, variant [Capsaspora owczarzaki ATCC 30864]